MTHVRQDYLNVFVTGTGYEFLQNRKDPHPPDFRVYLFPTSIAITLSGAAAKAVLADAVFWTALNYSGAYRTAKAFSKTAGYDLAVAEGYNWTKTTEKHARPIVHTDWIMNPEWIEEVACATAQTTRDKRVSKVGVEAEESDRIHLFMLIPVGANPGQVFRHQLVFVGTDLTMEGVNELLDDETELSSLIEGQKLYLAPLEQWKLDANVLMKKSIVLPKVCGKMGFIALTSPSGATLAFQPLAFNDSVRAPQTGGLK